MGLLDEAIREHLELKRRRGADPNSVAREEHEALAPVLPDEVPDDAGSPADQEARKAPAAPDEPGPVGAVSGDAPAPGSPYGDRPPPDLSAGGQETAELDMRSVMDANREDRLEWDLEDDEADGSIPGDIPGQERLSFE